MGRSRGGLTTTIHLLCNQFGEPLTFLPTGGQVADCTQAIALLGDRKAEAVLTDKDYDADAIVAHSESTGASPVIPPRSNRKHSRPYDAELYKRHNCIERCFPDLKQFRCSATRYDKQLSSFYSFLFLTSSILLSSANTA